MKITPDIRDTTCSATELGEMFELSLQRIGQLVQLGVLEKGADGFNLQRSIVAYERFLVRGVNW